MQTRLPKRLPRLALLIGLLSMAGLAARQPSSVSEMNAAPSSLSIPGSVTALRSADTPISSMHEATHPNGADWSRPRTPSTTSTEAHEHDDRPIFGEPGEKTTGQTHPGARLNLKTLKLRVSLARGYGLELQPTTAPTDDETEVAATVPAAAGSAESPQREPPPTLSSTEVVLRFLASGAGLAVGFLILFGVYAMLRPRVRAYLGSLRMRGMHRTRRERRRRDRNR